MADLAVTHPVVFGTYRLNDLPVLDLAVRQAIDAGVTLIDTAVMYNNDEAVAKIVRDTPARVGTKFKFPRTIAADLSRAIELFGPNLERVLLHRPMPYTAYAVLQLAPPLQHLYLNVNGLTAEAMPSLLQIVSSLPKLESLFIGENQLGDDAAALLERMPTRPLRRLELGSNGLTDAALPSLLAFATRHRDTLRSLELSSYKSTHYFRLKPNLLASTPAGADHLVAITSTGLAYLGLDNCLPSRAVAAALLARLSTGTAACSINARQRRTAHDDEGPSPLAEPRRATDTSAFLTAAAAVTVVSFAALGAVQARSTAAALAGVTAGLAAAMAGILVASGALQAPTNGKSTTTLAAVTYGSSTFSLLKHETEELQAIRRPPQLQHIFSIYRNAM